MDSKRDIFNMPSHLLQCVCGYLSPKDLINLSLCNSFMNNTISALMLKLNVTLGVRRYSNRVMGRNHLSKIDFDKQINKSNQMTTSKPCWHTHKMSIHLAKLQPLDAALIADIRQKLPKLLSVHSYLTYLLIEASASYDDGPFQQLEPVTILLSCRSLKYLTLKGRRMCCLPFHNTAADHADTFNLEYLHLTYVTPIGLAPCLLRCRRLQHLSIHDYG